MRKIAIVTTTRADWGLLSPVAMALRTKGVEPVVIATNMHFDKRRGYTIDEIVNDGFPNVRRAELQQREGNSLDSGLLAADAASQFSILFDSLKPDIVLLLGDRFEILAIALAATVFHIPIAHIAGGEITVGAFDDNIRHAITKLSSLHFVTTDEHRRRVIAMGEQPATVFNVGALGVENVLKCEKTSREELEESLCFKLPEDTVLITYHCATNERQSPEESFGNLLEALAKIENPLLFTYPNNDPGSEKLIEMIESFKTHNPDRVAVVPSLGRKRYIGVLNAISAVVGNSSSGLVEVPSCGIPTVNIGSRQAGRPLAPSVVNCSNESEDIYRALRKALSPEFREMAAKRVNPFYCSGTAGKIADVLLSVNCYHLLPKKFYDV